MNRSFIGVGLALGAGVGAAMFSVFHNPSLIALGTALGLLFGVTLSNFRKPGA